MSDMTPPANPEPLGSRYLLEEPIGAGAMGQVWRGSTREGQPVAIKVLRPELSSDPGLVAGFIQESQILTGLQSPHLVRVHDLVVEGSRLAIVMDLVQGPDLRTDLTRRGTFRALEAAAVVDGVLGGLATLHEGGVVHRDVKPENVLLADGQAGGARLTDFGIARLVEESQAARRTTVVGTPEYLAPEVADGNQPTAASDLYAVGIMLYELVSGVTPFSGGSPLAVLRRHAEQQPVRPEGMPDGIWDIIVALLAKDPAARPASAAAVREQVAAVAPSLAAVPPMTKLAAAPVPVVVAQPTILGLRAETEPGTTVQPPAAPAPKRRGKVMAVLAAVLVVALALGTAAFFLTRPTQTTPAAAAAEPTTSKSSTSSSSSSRSRSTRTSASTSASGGVVPSVTGLTLASAQAALSNAGLRVVVTEVLDDTIADNSVTAQNPIEGTRAQRGDTVTVTVARKPVAVSLTRLTPVNSYLEERGTAAVQMNGEAYIQALTAGSSCSGSVGVDYDLGRNYRTLKALVGVTDASSSSAVVQFDVIVDGRNVYSQTAKLGVPVALDVDVTGVLRLELRATRVDATCSFRSEATAVWANPLIFGAPGEVPSSTAAATPTN